MKNTNFDPKEQDNIQNEVANTNDENETNCNLSSEKPFECEYDNWSPE